jgi:predicted CoA-binding protein
MTTMQNIQDFLGLKRVAVVGVSRNPNDFTRSLFRDLRQRGYDVVPVNPALTEVEGMACLAKVSDATPPVEGALLMTSPKATDAVVHDCEAAGVRHVWMYRAAGAGAVSADAVEYCRSSGIDVVEGECPYMFLQGASWPHRLHGYCRKVFGHYPAAG